MVSIESISNKLVEGGASFVLQYGSSVDSPSTANDIDLFALTDQKFSTSFQLCEYDVLRVSENEFERYFEYLNPVRCTEPLLTGKVIAGDQHKRDLLKRELKEKKPHQEAVRHNYNKSIDEYQKAIRLFKQSCWGEFYKTMRFAISYRLFSIWYKIDKPPTPLKTVVEDMDHDTDLTEFFMGVNKYNNSKEDAQECLKSWENKVL